MFLSTIRANPGGWLIVAVIFVALSFSFAARMSLPVLIPGWEKEFGWSRTFLSGGAALIMIVMGATAILMGNLLDKFGPRYLVASGLVLSGASYAASAMMESKLFFIAVFCIGSAIGYGIISLPIATATISRQFVQGRGFAVSIGTAGVGGGQFLFLPFIAMSVVSVGWRPTLVVFGIVVIALGFLSLAFLDGKPIQHKDVAGSPAASSRIGTKIAHLMRHPVFWLIGGAYVICGFTTAGVVKVHLIPYAALCGFTLAEGAWTIGLLAGFDMVGMIASGWLTDRMHRPTLLGSVYFLRALTFIMLFFVTDNYPLLLFFAVLFGTLDFATVPPTSGLVASHLGLNTMGLTMGLLFAGHSIGGALGAWLAGYFFDLFALYDWVWMMGLALALVAAVLAWSVPEKRDAVPVAVEPVAA
jgi:MFS family permease